MIGKIDVDGKEYFLDIADVCPHCHYSLKLEVLSAVKSPEVNQCGVVFYCRHCKRLSFADLVLAGKVLNNSETKLRDLYPNPADLEIPPEMKVYYPKFYEIYRQAHRAEEDNLQEVVGMAYRKALEHLVKVYVTENSPNEVQAVANEPLGKSIARIEYPRIKALAKVAAWIGNDETHVVKQNTDLKVADMKNFMVALCHLILAEKAGDKSVQIILSKS